MKAILKFKLPEDQYDFTLASNANNYFSVIFEFDQYLRSFVKHNPDGLTSLEIDLVDEIRKKLRDIIFENNINLDL